MESLTRNKAVCSGTPDDTKQDKWVTIKASSSAECKNSKNVTSTTRTVTMENRFHVQKITSLEFFEVETFIPFALDYSRKG